MHPHGFETIELGTKETIENDGYCNRWVKSAQSSLLLITGLNHANVGYLEELWLSTAILKFSESMAKKGLKFVFYAVREEDCASTVVSAIISGILEWEQEFFKDQYPNLKKYLEPNGDTASNLNRKLQALEMVMNAWTRSRSHAAVYIILDRVDRFLQPEPHFHEKEALKAFIKSLVKLVQRTDGVFKFLLLAEATDWPPYSDFVLWTDISGPGRRFYQKLEWRQGFRGPYS